MRTVPGYLELDGYRLPTEAEWEYACRSGTITRWYHGDSEPLLVNYAWYIKNSDDYARPGGMLKPNDLGLFDMLGNVIEWTGDNWYSYRSNPTPLARNDQGYGEIIGKGQDYLYLKGGSYSYGTNLVRSGARNQSPPTSTVDVNGFRVVRTIPRQVSQAVR